MIYPIMADSVDPAAIPRKFAQKPNAVAAYRDGQWAWPVAEIDRWPAHIGITVLGQPAAANYARVIDVEHGDATVEEIPGFIGERTDLGHPDGTVYCARSTVGQALQVMPEVSYRFWIATLDGIYRTPEQLVAELLTDYGVRLAPSRVWAIQWLPMHSYDQSTVFGMADFDHHPV
jgi:hypothetical protein